MKRQQIVDRIEFDYNDRIDALLKTDNRCAHCGKQLTPGRGMEMDHFVPISKGGINQKLNIFPLCDDCNDRKRNKIVSPEWYLKYVSDKSKEDVTNYFDSYIKSFDALSRGNILLCDMYEIGIYMAPAFGSLKRLNPKTRAKGTKRFILERLFRDEAEEAENFFINYLKKYDILDNEDAARKNIEFWYRFGCIYCIRDSSTDELKMIIPITVKYDPERKKYSLLIHIFSKYAADLSTYIASELSGYIASNIAKEQALPYLRVLTYIPKSDPVSVYLNMDTFDDSNFATKRNLFSFDDDVDPYSYDENAHSFYQKMKDVKYHMQEFFSREGYGDISWMGDSIIPEFMSKEEDRKERESTKTA